MAQRISRAKQRIRGAGFALPGEVERADRLRVVLHVLYLIFNEGYLTGSGPRLHRTDLTGEAIRLARMLHRLVPASGEAAGLLALMLLTDARRAARVDADGVPVPLAEQRRELWDAGQVAEGVALLEVTLGRYPVGPYQVQAAIAAVHDEAAVAADTDWPQIAALYAVLDRLTPGPVVTLNRAVAVAMVDGPAAGLALLEPLAADPRVARSHRLDAVRGHLLELAGDRAAARECHLRAARGTGSLPERRYLLLRAARLAEPPRIQVLTDEQWARIEPLLPGAGGRGRPFADHRRVVEGMVHRERHDLPWRGLPAQFGPWQTVWKRHRRFTRDGTWSRIRAAL